MATWAAPTLCLVSDRRLRAGDPVDPDPDRTAVERLVAHIIAAARAGVDLVQIREPDLSDRCLVDVVRRVVAGTRDTRTRVVVNDRPDVALAGGADGVHLKDAPLAGARVRALGPAGWIIGRSVHDLVSARAAADAGAIDYLLVGTVFPTAAKPGRAPLGVAGLRGIARAVPLPVLAIGGVGVAEAGAVAATGASGLAGIRVFDPGTARAGGDAMAARVRSLRAAFDKGKALV